MSRDEDKVSCEECHGTGIYHHEADEDEGLEAYDEECRICNGSGYYD